MASAKAILEKLNKINQNNIREAVEKIVKKSKAVKEAKINELKSGVRPDGNLIGSYRNPEYALFKVRKNPAAGGRVDLILTGQFSQGLFVESKGESVFSFDSKDKKAEGLFNKYGQDLKGLNQETFNEVLIINHSDDFIRELKKISGFK